MKTRYIAILIFIFLLIIFSLFLIKFINHDMPSVKKDNKIDYEIKQIKEENDRYVMDIYYPLIQYEDLNCCVDSLINSYIENFKLEVEKFSKEKKYSLNITFDFEKQNNYITFIFNIVNDFGLINNQKYVETITYDISKNKIITINDLIYKNKGLLDYISKYCYESLMGTEYIKSFEADKFVEKGTTPIISNFENFSLSNDNLVIYFKQYQLVPHYTDIIKVEIPLIYINI